MRKVKDHLDEKLKKSPEFKERYNLILQKLEVAKKIIGYRVKHNLTQRELANELGVTQQYISKIEEGDFSTLDMADLVLFKMGYRLTLKVEPSETKSRSPYAPKEFKKPEKIIAERSKVYKSAKRAKKHVKV